MSKYKIINDAPFPTRGREGGIAKAKKNPQQKWKEAIHAAYESWRLGDIEGCKDKTAFVNEIYMAYPSNLEPETVLRWIRKWNKLEQIL